MFFTIIVATYNSEKTIEKCISSITEQDYEDKELIVIDGASKDSTVEKLEQFKDNIEYFLSEPDRGVYDAWNKAMSVANGEWVIFLGSDDMFYDSTVLTRYAKRIHDAGESVNIVFGEVILVENIIDINSKLEHFGTQPEEYYQHTVLKEAVFSHTGSCHRRQLIMNHGGFNTDLKIGADYDMMLKFLKNDVSTLRKLDYICCYMSSGGLSSSIKSKIQTYRDSLTARKLNSIPGQSLPLLTKLGKAYLASAIFSIFGDRVFVVASNFYRRLAGKSSRKGYM